MARFQENAQADLLVRSKLVSPLLLLRFLLVDREAELEGLER